MIKVKNNSTLLTVTIIMNGTVTDDELVVATQEMKKISESYRGKPHLVLADIRGLKPLSAHATTLLYNAMAHSRRHGVKCCVHLSDSAIARMQAARVAREATAGDDETIEVVSLEEAEEVLKEQRLNIWSAV
jgi:hypothetical protein